MGIELITGLYDYHRWANRRLFEHAAGLGDAALTRDVGSQFSFPTVKGMFAHLYAADRIWLERWKGTSPTRLYGDADFPTMGDLRMSWDELEAEQRRFVEALGPGDLERTVDFKDTRGNPYSLPLGPLLQHVANHATHHRSEIATMITMVSGSPPDTGINSYLLILSGQTKG
jgi:uncharacterized damage-inducible protein DinB